MALADSLYPFFGVSQLRSKQGQHWAEIVDYVSGLDSVDPHVMAFTLTLRRLRRQNQIDASVCKDPFCAVCAASVVESYKGTEEALVRFYYANLAEIEQTMKSMNSRRIERPAISVREAEAVPVVA